MSTLALVYGYWWTILIPAMILVYAYVRKHIAIYLFSGISMVCQFMSFLAMTGSFGTIFWLRNPYNYFWGETLALSFLLIGASSLYRKIGTLLGAIFGTIYTVLWLVDPLGWFNRYEIVSLLIVALSAVKTYSSYRKRDNMFPFLLFFTLGFLLAQALYPLTFRQSLFPGEVLRVMFIVISFLWALLALVNSRKKAS